MAKKRLVNDDGGAAVWLAGRQAAAGLAELLFSIDVVGAAAMP